MLWDIFCKVIDNHGDIGVCWRLCAQLAARGHQVRLWVDDASALGWMAPEGAVGVQVLPWDAQGAAESVGGVVVEAFGCELTPAFQARIAARTEQTGAQPPWVNLEYLSAESFSERSHGLPSPVTSGPARGLTKHFFYPGFTARTGGLLREEDLEQCQAAFDPQAWRRLQGLPDLLDDGEAAWVSLFCYEPAGLPGLLSGMAAGTSNTRLLVTAGRATAAASQCLADLDRECPGWNAAGRLAISWLPLLSQKDYDHLLWACDFNFVRGEDSLVRALWAGKPFVWQIYPQDDDAHHAKLAAFLDWLEAPASLRAFYAGWNGIASGLPQPGIHEWGEWRECVIRARAVLLEQDDLATQLIRLAIDRKNR